MTTPRRKREECEHEGVLKQHAGVGPQTYCDKKTSSREIGITANNGDAGLPLDYG